MSHQWNFRQIKLIKVPIQFEMVENVIDLYCKFSRRNMQIFQAGGYTNFDEASISKAIL